MTEPAAFDAETTPTISLGGKEWPVPELVWRDLRRCRKELLELTGLLNVASSEAPESGDNPGSRSLNILGDVFQSLSNEDFDRLVIGVIFVGVSAMHPNLKRDELDGWRITESEAEIAWLTVRRQSGLFIFRAPPADEDLPPGEAAEAA